MLTKANLDSIRFASKDETRPALSGLNVRADYTEATDGYRLVRVPLESNGTTGLLKSEPVQIMNKVTKRTDLVSFEGSILEGMGSGNLHSRLMAVLDTDSTYPDCDKVWPDVTKEYTRVGFNPAYLSDIGAFLKRFTSANACALYFHPTEPELRPVVIVCDGIQAVLMPVKLDDSADIRK
jgi:DNA polymerase III sliding clamp (beta) subunit (PCNA family)